MNARCAIALLLLGIHSWGHAEWREVGRNQDLVLYQDAASDIAEGANIKTRELQNYLTESTFFGMKVGSRVLVRVYDCGARMRRAVRAEMFERAMGEGKAFDWSDMPDAPWQAVGNEPLGTEGLAAACQRAGTAK
jgi:hypothetical protein